MHVVEVDTVSNHSFKTSYASVFGVVIIILVFPLRFSVFSQNKLSPKLVERLPKSSPTLKISNYTIKPESTTRPCAPWIHSNNRKVVIAHHQFAQATWENYQKGEGYKGGEAYWCASLDYTLRHLGFQTEFFTDLDTWLDNQTNVVDLREGRVHRVITNALFTRASDDDGLHIALLDPLVRCRVRSFWGIGADWQGKIGTVGDVRNSVAHAQAYDWDLRSSLSLWPGKYGTPVNTFVHSMITVPEEPFSDEQIKQDRGRNGLVFGKNCRSIMPRFIDALIQGGFHLHVACKSASFNAPGVINHGYLTPLRFIHLLRNMSFIIGVGEPLDSPTPLEAIANGAAFLNPFKKVTVRQGGYTVHSQHQGLKTLGMPYVYNVDLDNITDVLSAAERAVRNRFHSFIPFWNRIESVSAQVCSNLVESEALCDCAVARKTDPQIDCRGSFYATNSGLVEDELSAYAPA